MREELHDQLIGELTGSDCTGVSLYEEMTTTMERARTSPGPVRDVIDATDHEAVRLSELAEMLERQYHLIEIACSLQDQIRELKGRVRL